jgi:hypothetical protein
MLMFTAIRRTSILAAVLFVATQALSQTEHLWSDVREEQFAPVGRPFDFPVPHRTLALDFAAMRAWLRTAPMERTTGSSPLVVSIPTPDGAFQRFGINQYSMMEASLAARFPDILTYHGQGIDNPVATIRLDVTPAGIHAMVFAPNATFLIDPHSQGDVFHYVCYARNGLVRGRPFTAPQMACNLVASPQRLEELRQLVAMSPQTPTGPQLRTYRLACAATGEYTQFHGGTVTLGQAAIVTAMNRVNGIYETELAVRMTLVANNSGLVYTNGATDPYTNNDGFAMLSENQSNIDLVIGSANYDIGHVFSTGGGGVAGLGVVCAAGSKAEGVTGLPNPIGDPFYVDYVAHEMGHQFGGNHTFNSNVGSCGGGNRNASTAYEPGSGSTIQAYAGICGSHDLQANSDAYFHTISFDEMVAYTNSGGGSSCAVITNTGNSAPVITVPTGGFTIPKSTPFTLTGSATDPNGDALTFCWEEFDLGPAGDPNTPSGNAPIFRSFSPTTNATRTFPKLSDLLNNTQTIGEILPSYARTLTFRLTARDNRSGGGGVDRSSNVQFTVNGTAGPFTVTAPNTAVSWEALTTQTITWDVSNTNIAPVNCANVKISLSTDGGTTFPIVILSSTPNDGVEAITVPDNQTTTARIKVEAVGNIFFDISNVNFTITASVPIQLASFTGRALDRTRVLLEWRTISEVNNYGFEIERAANERGTFEGIPNSFVPGSGTTTEPRYYQFTHTNASASFPFYRLKQIDLDGTVSYFDPIRVSVPTSAGEGSAPVSFALGQNYPNPFNPSTNISFSIHASGVVSLQVFDVLGRAIATLVNETKAPGEYSVPWDATDVPSGVYFYKLVAGNSVAVKKLMVAK